MARVTASEVKDIIDTDLIDARVNAYINSANILVNEVLVNEGLSDALLTEIERWLAAHYITCNERQAIQQVAGPAEQRFSDVFGKHLLSSTFGQTAAQLDTTGKLAKLGQKTVTLKAISEDES